jgi:hypothetical protein
MNTIPFRKLSGSDLTNRGVESGPAYAEYLRESSPMGSVVAINLLTGEYVVGGGLPRKLSTCTGTIFGKKAEPNMWLEPIHWPTTPCAR